MTTHKRNLPCKLTEKELVHKGAELARCVGRIQTLTDERKDIADSIKREKTAVTDLQTEIVHRQELRLVECEVKHDLDVRRVFVTRLDNLAIVEHRPMTVEELQLEFDFDDDGEPEVDAEAEGTDEPPADSEPEPEPETEPEPAAE